MSRLPSLIVFAVLISQLAASAEAMETAVAATAIPTCVGKYKGGLKPTPEELGKIPKVAEEVVAQRGLNLCEANLANANLAGANLENTDLTGANLEAADLEG